MGCEITLSPEVDVRLDALLFGESQSRIVFSAKSGTGDALKELLRALPVRITYIGRVVQERFTLHLSDKKLIDIDTEKLSIRYESAIPELMTQ